VQTCALPIWIEAQATATTALLAANLPAKHVADAIRLIDVGAEDIEAEIASLAERMPALFEPVGAATPPPPAGVTPPRPPAGTGGGKSAKERAAERFKPRHMPPAA